MKKKYPILHHDPVLIEELKNEPKKERDEWLALKVDKATVFFKEQEYTISDADDGCKVEPPNEIILMIMKHDDFPLVGNGIECTGKEFFTCLQEELTSFETRGRSMFLDPAYWTKHR